MKKTRHLLLLAAIAAITAAHAVVIDTPDGSEKEKKVVGGNTFVFTEATWKTCRHINGLEYRDETVMPDSLSHDEPLHRISVRNLLSAPRKLIITANDLRGCTTRRELQLDPLATATVTIPVFMTGEFFSRCEGQASSIHLYEPKPPALAAKPSLTRSEELDTVIRPLYQDSYYADKNHNLLLSDGITRDNVLPLFMNDFNTSELRRGAADWPRDFRTYLPFDAVLMTEEVASALPEETRTALRAFKLLGGAVLTAKDGTKPPENLESIIGKAAERRKGDLDTHWYYRSGYGNTSEHFSKVPIKVGRSLPVGLLIWLLAIVALVAMPGMVWYCAKKNRRLLLLAVLPASAFALTAVVAVIALAAYGTTPTLRVQSTTILDPASRLAVTRGQFAVFAPGQVSRKMSIPSDASFCLRSRDGIVDQLSVDYAESCRLEGNWVKPLSAAFFDFERAERRSERLDVKRGADGSITVANLLGSSIVEGFIQLGGMRYRVPPLAPGAEAAVSEKVPSVETSPSTTPAEALAERLFSASTNYGRRWSSTLEIASNTKTPLPDGTYIVRMVGSPFFPSPLAGTKAYETMESVVAGCIAAEAGKEASK